MATTRRRFFGVLVAAGSAAATRESDAQAGILPPEEAFRLRARRADVRAIDLMWMAAPGTYLYRDRLCVRTDDPRVVITKVEMPAAHTKYDRALEREVAYYEGSVTLRVNYQGPPVAFKLVASAQGCAEVGVCYPPVSHEIVIRGGAS